MRKGKMHHIESTLVSSYVRRVFGYSLISRTVEGSSRSVIVPCRHSGQEFNLKIPAGNIVNQIQKQMFDDNPLESILVDPRKHIGCIDIREIKELRMLLNIKAGEILPIPIDHEEFIELGAFFGDFNCSVEEEKIRLSTFDKTLLLANAYFFTDFEEETAPHWSGAMTLYKTGHNKYNRIVLGFVPKLSLQTEINQEALSLLIRRKEKELRKLSDLQE